MELRRSQSFFRSNRSGADTFSKSINGSAPARGYNKFCMVPIESVLKLSTRKAQTVDAMLFTQQQQDERACEYDHVPDVSFATGISYQGTH